MSTDRLKFRVWDCESKIYRDASEDGVFMLLPDGGLVQCGIRDGMHHFADKSRFIVERCTGLEDKDGAIIYEGDILEMKRHVFLEEFKVERYAVEYSPMLARWRLGKSCIYLNKDTAAECKVVGNVHQNAEDSKKMNENEFRFADKTYVAVEDLEFEICSNCIFKTKNPSRFGCTTLMDRGEIPHCAAQRRKDGKNVHFVEKGDRTK